MLLTKDFAGESTNITVEFVQDIDLYCARVGKLSVDQAEPHAEVEIVGFWSSLVTLVTEEPTAQALAIGSYTMGTRWLTKEETVPVYGIPGYGWAPSQIGYSLGTKNRFPAEVRIAEAGPIRLVSLGGGMLSIGCAVSTADEHTKLPGSLERRLTEIGSLQQNWDSYSAKPISEKAIERARSLLVEAGMRCGKGLLESAFVAPCSDGGIQLEFKSESEPQQEFTVRLEPNGKTGSLLVTDTSGREKEKRGVALGRERWDAELGALCSKKKSLR